MADDSGNKPQAPGNFRAALGTAEGGGRLILRCKTQVTARQERCIGLRFVDVGRDQLLALRAELGKLSSPAG